MTSDASSWMRSSSSQRASGGEEVGAGGRLLRGAVRRTLEWGSIAACLVASPLRQVVVDGAWTGRSRRFGAGLPLELSENGAYFSGP